MKFEKKELLSIDVILLFFVNHTNIVRCLMDSVLFLVLFC